MFTKGQYQAFASPAKASITLGAGRSPDFPDSQAVFFSKRLLSNQGHSGGSVAEFHSLPYSLRLMRSTWTRIQLSTALILFRIVTFSKQQLYFLFSPT